MVELFYEQQLSNCSVTFIGPSGSNNSVFYVGLSHTADKCSYANKRGGAYSTGISVPCIISHIS